MREFTALPGISYQDYRCDLFVKPVGEKHGKLLADKGGNMGNNGMI